MNELSLDFSERILFALRRLYDRHGYRRYRMNKFEEYDLYARNKDFLISDHVLTFTDSDGKLMALKPDVTLSIVKNSPDKPGLQKLYYNENVYRVSRDTPGFREIMQLGLECLGQVDLCCIREVLHLAAESLDCVCPDWVLTVSHLGLLLDCAGALGIPEERRNQMMALIGAKNRHELHQLCRDAGLSGEQTSLFTTLARTAGSPAQVIPALKALLEPVTDITPLTELEQVLTGLDGRVKIDFSVVDDVHYYNGIVFKGFLRGISEPVLTGGQYDKLMKKMKRAARAIGFAVYTDLLEGLEEDRGQYDVDTLLVYDPAEAPALVHQWAERLAGEGVSVLLQPGLPEDIRCRRVLKLEKGEVTILENHA